MHRVVFLVNEKALSRKTCWGFSSCHVTSERSSG